MATARKGSSEPPPQNPTDQDPKTQDQEDPDNSAAAAASESKSAPVPEPGPRAARFQEIYEASLRRTLDKLSWDNLSGCYPTVASRAEPVLRQVQSQMVEKLRERCEREFEGIMASRGVVAKLNELERLVGDAEKRRRDYKDGDAEPTPAHLLPPSQILNAHLSTPLTAHTGTLNAKLQNTQAQNARLADQIRQQREEIDALLDALDAAVEDVKGANSALGPVVGELAAEARDVDAHMAGTTT